MKRKKLLSFLLITALLLSGCSVSAMELSTTSEKKRAELTAKGKPFWETQAAKQAGETVTVAEYDRPLSYVLQYPKTGKPAIDSRIEAIVNDVRNAFAQEYLPPAAPNGETVRENKTEATLYLGYEAYLTEEKMLSLLFFDTTETTEGMSPHTRIQAFHFDLEQDQELLAADLIWEGFAENASAYTRSYFTTTEPYCDRIFGNYNTLLAVENGLFDRFAFTSEGVLFHFDRYELFPGSMGIVSLLIPYEDMRAKAPIPEEEISQPVTDRKMVALTFDDGPNPIYTNQILDTLEKYDARATFFDLGHLVEKYPDVVKREDALGCEVASHSYNHKNFDKISDETILADLKKTDAAFQKVLGRSPDAFRPPYGNCSEHVKTLIPMPIYLWSVDTVDWKSRNANAIIHEVTKLGDLDGRVILMHGIYSATAEATAYLVPYLQEQGYELVTVSELIEAKHGETPENGKIYGYYYFQ